MKNIKFIAINTKDEELSKKLSQSSNSIYEIDSALFDKNNESYTRLGLAGTTLIGNLASDPEPMLYPFAKNAKVSSEKKDYVNDSNYIYFSNFCYETNVYWDNKTGNRHAINNYIGLIFQFKGAKSMILHYQKGDSMILHGYLRSILAENPQDNTRNVNVQYLIVEDFVASPGTHINKAIRTKFNQIKTVNKYNTVEDIINDKNLSDEECGKLMVAFYRNKQKPQVFSESKNSKDSPDNQCIPDNNQLSVNDDLSQTFDNLDWN